MTEPILRAIGLTKTYRDAGREIQPIQGLNLEIGLGETLAVVGPSGSGKTTLLQLLGGLDQPSAGSLDIQGQRVSALDDQARTALRSQQIGFVYQFHHLLGEFSALENVAMPLRVQRVPAEQASVRAQQMLAQVGLADRLQHRPSQLSGGERQRVAIARALVTQPSLVLADEPTGNLDRETAALVFDLLVARVREARAALVVVTHDPDLAQRCDRSLVLSRSAAHR